MKVPDEIRAKSRLHKKFDSMAEMTERWFQTIPKQERHRVETKMLNMHGNWEFVIQCGVRKITFYNGELARVGVV